MIFFFFLLFLHRKNEERNIDITCASFVITCASSVGVDITNTIARRNIIIFNLQFVSKVELSTIELEGKPSSLKEA
jgi:hypothetical protein